MEENTTANRFHQCTTCDKSQQQYICNSCKLNGNHKGHNMIEITDPDLPRFCNCGDGTGQYHCSKHRQRKFPDKENPLYLNAVELNHFNQAFKIDEQLSKKLSRLNQIRYVASDSVDGQMIQTYLDNSNAHGGSLKIHRCWSVYRKDHEKNFYNKEYKQNPTPPLMARNQKM